MPPSCPEHVRDTPYMPMLGGVCSADLYSRECAVGDDLAVRVIGGDPVLRLYQCVSYHLL
jgi:hypothetical protein